MKKLFLLLLFIPGFLLAATQEVIEVDIKGMSCPFCSIGINKRLHKLPFVEGSDVSLRNKKAKVIIKAGKKADIDAIKKAILDAGFSPDKIERYQVEIEDK